MGDRPAVLFLGRRDCGKGYPALLQAWRKVLERHPQAVLLLAGPAGEDFSDELRALDGDSIRDLRIPDEQAKADALAACDIFCLPSAHESFGIVYAEAWSYGKPVICGPAPACREWIHEGQTGLWAEQTPDSIARSIGELLSDPGAARQMGRAGKQFQQTHLTTESFLLAHQNAFGLTKPQ
jgi:glycosyltransferase involved in cell wall biosynthesis